MKTAFGLTGGIASGKSTVGRIFAEHGIHVFDADQISREVMRPGEACYDEIIATFGEAFVDSNDPLGRIDRKKLGQLVFRYKPALQTLEKIQWEYIHQRFVEKSLQVDGLICYEASQLVESNYWLSLRPLVVVDIDPLLQRARLMDRNRLTEAEAELRMSSQNPGRAVAHADYLIRNDGDLDQLRAQVEDFLKCRPFLDRCRTGGAED